MTLSYIILGVVTLVLANLLYLTRTVATLTVEITHIKEHLGCGKGVKKKSRGGKKPKC